MPRTPVRKKVRITTAFHAAVEATPSVRGAHRPGLQALLRADRERIDDGPLATGSIALDEALARAEPNSSRWDYGIGLPKAHERGESVLWLEVHHAASGETEAVLKKLAWLRRWLREQAPRLDALPKTFVWQLSNVERHPNDRARRNRLAEQHGLRRVEGKLRLAGHT
jgi:hypothetical protein